MKLLLEFIPIEDERKPDTLEDIFVLTPTSWYVDTYNGDFLPADVTHWASIDMTNLK